MTRLWLSAVMAAMTLSGCNATDTGTYTLYRDSPLTPGKRIHVATFDTDEGNDYNSSNCATAADLFNGQGAMSRFWCEKGRFKA